MARLELKKRAALSEMLRSARESRGWSQEQASERATEALRELAGCLDDAFCSVEERRLWLVIEVTRRHVVALENCPSSPLANSERRARLLGLVTAVGVDMALINRLAGGL